MTKQLKTTPRERFLETILQSAIEYAIFSLDLQGSITSWNEGATRIFGWTAEEAAGQPGSIIFTEEDRQAGAPQREMETALSKNSAMDQRWHLRKDGSLFWASGEMMALRSDEGAVEGFVKILRDRTDQRENEDRQRMLMHELNHRMKNTLAVVQAIVSQSFRGATSLDEASASVSARLAAYSKAHDILLQRNWQGTTMSAIVEETAASLALDSSQRFRMQGPLLELGPQAALSFALVLHELATNARKYGALSAEEGSVDVTWSVLTFEGKRRFQFTWEEADGPKVEQPARKGFGSRLLSTSLKAFGTAVVEYLPEGVRVEVTGDLETLQNKAFPDAVH
ncbi:sensor histidine kinase [Rhizobium halophilum]|uniref:sensor histidine kinase n=1 Tax=Rhizobium halophilum TaxID=2846852 RepID=UPI001EFE4A48|nr:HWE histidine kinase domain-containing protein [Rhizobium halophilum]MCF6367603.1 PAS domain S-box protein [Rhizobium halophilum]